MLVLDKLNEKVHSDIIEDKGRAINAAIIAKTITVRTKLGNSSEAVILAGCKLHQGYLGGLKD